MERDLSLLSEVVAVVREKLPRCPATIEAGTKLTSDLGVDSVQAVELVVDVEERFDCQLPDVVVRDIRTVGDLAVAIAGARVRVAAR